MTNRFVPVIHGAALDRPDEVDTIATAEAVCESLRRLSYKSEVIALAPDLAALGQLASRQPHIVFNLVEALDGKATGALHALELIEKLQLPCSGASLKAYAASNSKIDTKERLARHGLPTPIFWQANELVPPDATVIIKSIDEHGSLGMDQGSVVEGAQAAGEIACREAEFGCHFFAEDYIEGREFNVSVIEGSHGPVVLPLAEIDFSALPPDRHAIVDFSAKWDPDDMAYQATPRRFGVEKAEPHLARQLNTLTLACWHAFGLTGYARVDFRVDAAGQPYVLEVNANPCLAPDAGFSAAANTAGYIYDEIIAAIVDAAVRHNRQAA